MTPFEIGFLVGMSFTVFMWTIIIIVGPPFQI